MDSALKDLSYSSFLTLHSCPRRYELYKLGACKSEEDEEEVHSTNVTFAFGHAVGLGIQEVLLHENVDEAIFKMFCGWDTPNLFDENKKQAKSLWFAIQAVQRFAHVRSSGFLRDWELVTYNGVPAAELGYCINLPDGFRLRGFVDVVLKNKINGKVMVLELKTSSTTRLHEAMYKNSAQAVGYSVVLDAIFPELSSYEVMYLVYLSKSMEYAEPMIFSKSYVQRALWIREVLLDIETIKMYSDAGVFPTRGESCYDFYRTCEYYGICTMKNESLINVAGAEGKKKKEETFQINLTLQDLLESQYKKVTS